MEELNFEDRLELQVECKCVVNMQLAPGEPATRMRWLNAEGETLSFTVHESNSASNQYTYSFPESGPVPKMVVSESARTLVLLKGGRELRRIPVDLRWNETNELRP